MTLAGDTYGSSLLQLLGCFNVFTGRGTRYPTVELADGNGKMVKRAAAVAAAADGPIFLTETVEHERQELRFDPLSAVAHADLGFGIAMRQTDVNLAA